MASSGVNLQTMAFSADQIRQAESAMMKTMPPETLMARAAFGCAVRLRRHLRLRDISLMHSKIVALIGKGNNGGDTLFVVADCARRGARVDAFVVGGTAKVHQGGLLAAMNAGVRVHELESVTGQVDPTRANLAGLLREADLVLDGLLGIGATGQLREPLLSFVKMINESNTYCVAVDVPTGVDPTTGDLNPTGLGIQASLTVTFGALKAGLLTGPGGALAGELELVDIGLGPYLPAPIAKLVTQVDIDELISPAHRLSDKYSRGVVGVIAGSQQYPGASLLAVGAARQAGVGMVRYAGPCADEVVARYPDVVATQQVAQAGRAQAWLVGSGLGTSAGAIGLLSVALDLPTPLVIDADGLNLLAQEFDPKFLAKRALLGWPTFITPHQGEAGRLRDPLKNGRGLRGKGHKDKGRIDFAQELADRWSSICVLKGSGTVVAQPKGEFVWLDAFADASLATAGSGDVLAGFLAGLIAHRVGALPDQGVDSKSLSGIDWPWLAAVAVAWHGLAGQGPQSSRYASIRATDVLSNMGSA